MPVFELYNADGSLQMDLSTATTRRLGESVIGLAAGTVTHPGFSQGKPWFTLVRRGSNLRSPLPTVTRSGSGSSTVISWTARGSGDEFLLTYGVY